MEEAFSKILQFHVQFVRTTLAASGLDEYKCPACGEPWIKLSNQFESKHFENHLLQSVLNNLDSDIDQGWDLRPLPDLRIVSHKNLDSPLEIAIKLNVYVSV